MSSKKINQLPLFPGTDTSEVYLVVNDKTETTTYKIKKETLLGTSGNSGNSGTSGVNGNSGTSGISGTSGVNGSNSGTSGVSGTAGTSGTSQTLTSLTYSAFDALITNSGLIKGCFYEINDYETCYDQPDFNPTWNEIEDSDNVTSGNYKTSGVIQPIIVFATATNEISIDAFQAAYPKDKIQYDWTIAATEVTSNPAKGRIIERIDEFNNRTDYDHRNILFKRYTTYIPNQKLPGSVDVSNGTVMGTDTTFTSLSIGDRIWVKMNTGNQLLGNLEYMITNIVDDTNMTVTGITFANTYDATFYTTDTMTGYKRNNTSNPSGFTEHYTFDLADPGKFYFNNYIGNYGNLKNWSEGYNTASVPDLRDSFYLANNVFIYDSVNNIIGDNAYNNTFGECVENIIGAGFKENNSSNLKGNVIGNDFANNTIKSFSNNKIGNYFYKNVITCGTCFDRNQIGFAFYKNIITCVDFSNNIVGNEFYNNKISNGEFNDNTIGRNFINNTITTANFNKNQIAIDFKNNINIIGDFKNNIYQIGTNGKDYLAATHVYQTYTCVVFTNAASIQKLSYYDATDVLIITTPNS